MLSNHLSMVEKKKLRSLGRGADSHDRLATRTVQLCNCCHAYAFAQMLQNFRTLLFGQSRRTAHCFAFCFRTRDASVQLDPRCVPRRLTRGIAESTNSAARYTASTT